MAFLYVSSHIILQSVLILKAPIALVHRATTSFVLQVGETLRPILITGVFWPCGPQGWKMGGLSLQSRLRSGDRSAGCRFHLLFAGSLLLMSGCTRGFYRHRAD